MGNTLPIQSFTIEATNPSGTIVQFVITDNSCSYLTTSKDIRSVLCDAIQQWIDANRTALDTNGDTDVQGAPDVLTHGDIGFAAFDFVFESVLSTVELTALTGITLGTFIATVPFADVA